MKQHHSGIAAAWVRRDSAKWILAAAAGFVFTGIFTIPLFLGSTHATNFRAAKDSASNRASDRLKATFPQLSASLSSQVVAVIRSTEGSVLTEMVECWSKRIVDIMQTDERALPFRPLVAGFFTGTQPLGLPPGDDLLRKGFVSEDNRSTVVSLLATASPRQNGTYSPWAYKFWFMSLLRQVAAISSPAAVVHLTGSFVTYFDELRSERLESMLLWAEARVIPTSLLVLAILVREVRLLWLPLILLLVSCCAVPTLVLPFAYLFPLSTDLPPSMVSIVIALTMDYCLFVLVRFNENRALGMGTERNVGIVVVRTGRTIALSGCLIAVAYLGAVLLPEENLRNAGIALAVCTLTVVVVHITVLPAMLLLFGEFLTSPLPVPAFLEFVKRSGGRHSSRQPDTQWQTLQSDNEQVSIPSERAGADSLAASLRWPWGSIMSFMQERPVTALAAVVVLFMPILVQMPQLRASADAYGLLPMNIASVTAFRELPADFAPGRFEPYMVLVEQSTSSVSNSFLTRAGHEAFFELARALSMESGVASMLGPVWLLKEGVDWGHEQLLDAKIRELYTKVVSSHMLANGTAAMLQVHTSFLPRGPEGLDWILKVRATLEEWERQHPEYNAYLAGPLCEAVDSHAAVMGAMPQYLALTLFVVVLVVFFMFGSVFLPLRFAIATLFTLVATFGVTVLVYQTPLLHSLWPWLSHYDGLCYQVIPTASCVAVALGIDYDIFLVSRIVEYREMGLSDSDSITAGLSQTGGVISGAGLIMSLAFSGLFFSEKLLHQQLALTLVTSVLLDTFVVRTLLVPALMLVARDWLWWPRKFRDPSELAGPSTSKPEALRIHPKDRRKSSEASKSAC